MKLYYNPGSCALASQIALREAGLEFELIKVDFQTKRTSEGNYFEVTKKGLIPAIKLDNGDVITEGAVILQWIADQKPEKNILPAFGTKERYLALQWLNFIATDLHKGMATMFSPFVDESSKMNFAEGNLASRFTYVDEHLTNNDYILGNEYSVADGYLYNVLRWPVRVNINMTKYSNIMRFMERMEQRPLVQASLKAEGLILNRYK